MTRLQDKLYIRQMEAEDIDQVMKIEKASYDFCWTRGIFFDCIKSGYHCLVLADHDDVYGYAILIVGLEEAHILNICISKHIRGQGWARFLMQNIIDLCTSTKSDELFLEVRPSNPVAIGLYHSLGFNEVDIRPGYYKTKDGREDAIVMVRSIQV